MKGGAEVNARCCLSVSDERESKQNLIITIHCKLLLKWKNFSSDEISHDSFFLFTASTTGKHYVSLSSLLSISAVVRSVVEIAIGVVVLRSLNNGFCEDV